MLEKLKPMPVSGRAGRGFVRKSGDKILPAKGGGNAVEGRQVPVGAGLSETGDVGQDQTGVDLGKLFIPQIPAPQCSGPEVLQHNIRQWNQLLKESLPSRDAQIQGDALLVSV